MSDVIGKLHDAAGRKVVVVSRKPFASAQASAGFAITDRHGSTIHADLGTPELREKFALLLRDAYAAAGTDLGELLDRAAMPGQPAVAAGCPQPGCSADPATASGGLPPKWCTGACQPATEPLVTRPAGHPDVIAWDMAHGDPGPQREASDD